MAKNNSALYNLWEAASKDYQLGTYDEFQMSMANPASRKNLYDTLSADYDLGTLEDYDSTMVSELNKSYIKTLWNNATNGGYDLSTPRDFKQQMKDEAYRKKFYESRVRDGVDLGTYENFNQQVAGALKADEPKSWVGRKAQNLWNATVSGLMTVGNQAMDLGNLGMGFNIDHPVYKDSEIRMAHKLQKEGTVSMDERRAAQKRVAEGKGSKLDKELSSSLDVADKAAEMQAEVAQAARRDLGEDDNFVDLIKHGNIGSAIELGMITALESMPQMLFGHDAAGRVLLGTLSAADEYDRLLKERPNMSKTAQVSQAIFHGAIEQLWERWGNPLKLGKAKVTVGGTITRQIREWATKTWRDKLKSIGKGVVDWLKETTDEGMEEVMTDLSNAIFDTLLGAADENAEGLMKEYKEAAAAAAENGEELTKQQFAFNKAKETLNSFIGGAAAGGIMGAGGMAVNKAAAHHAKYQVQEDGKTRRMTKTERKEMRQTADMAMRAMDEIAQEEGVTRKQVLDEIDAEQQEIEDWESDQSNSVFGHSNSILGPVKTPYITRYYEILARYQQEMQQTEEAQGTETTTEEQAANEQEAAAAEPAQTEQATAEEQTTTEQGARQETAFFREPKTEKKFQFVRNEDGTLYMVKDGKPVTSHTWTTDELAEKGWHYVPTSKKITQQPAVITLNGQQVHVHYTCDNAVFNEDGSINLEESSKVFIFPSDVKKHGSGRFSKGDMQAAITALQQSLIDAKKAKEEQAQQTEHGQHMTQPAYTPGTTPANALTAEQQAEAGAKRIEAEKEKKRKEEIEKLRNEKPYPITDDGEPDFANMTPAQQVAYAEESGGAEMVLQTIDAAMERLTTDEAAVKRDKKLTPVEMVKAQRDIAKKKAEWEALKEKYTKKEPENLENQEKSITFAQAKDGKPTRLSINITQNAGEDAADGAHNRLDAQNEADRVAYKEALNTLRNEEATDEERTAAEETIQRIETQRKEQMTQLAQEALKGIEGVRLVGVEEGTGVYLNNDGNEVIEYTSVVEVEVEEGSEAAAIAAMAAIAQVTKQDSYIVNYPTEGNTVYGVPESYKQDWQKPSPAAQVVVPLRKPLTQKQKAVLTKAFVDAGLGVTITEKEISTSNFTFENDEEFYKVVDDILKTFNDGNAKTEIQDGRGLQSTEGESVVQGESGSRGDIRLLGEPIHRKKYSHYNEATQNGNDRDYTTVVRTDSEWNRVGDQSLYEQEEGSSALRVPHTAISREDLLQRLQNVYDSTEEAMSSPDARVPKEEQTPAEWTPDEVVNLQDDDVVVLLHYTREHYPLVKVARVTEEDGKRVYHEIGKDGNIIDAEKGNWHEMDEKKIVEDENGVQYLFIDFDGRIKRRGIPLLATNEQLEAINQQNRPKASGLKGLTELKTAPQSKAAAAEEISNMQAALEKPLVRASGTKLTISLLDILSMRPYTTEVTEIVKDENGKDVQKTSVKVVSVWQQIAAKCDKMARESQDTTNKKYGKQADELLIAEQAAALMQDVKKAYRKHLEAWNKLVRKNGIDQLIAEHIDEIDPELVATYRALHEKIYRKPKTSDPSAVVQPNFKDRLFTNVDDNIFRYTQVVAEMVRQACEASHITDVEDILDMAVLRETPWRETSTSIRKKHGHKTVEDIKKEILESLDIENVHSAEEILKIKQRVGKMRKLFEDKKFEEDYERAVQVAEEHYGRTDEIDELFKKRKKKEEKKNGSEIKTLQLALAAARKKGDTDRVQKIENRLKELQSEEAAATDAEERQKRYDQLRKQLDYFYDQKKKAKKEGDATAEAQADEMIGRYEEELDKMDAEMQRGQSIMPNATPAQRFVTNVVLKALKNIRGITVHHATKVDVERILARLNEGKTKAEPLSTSDGTVYGWSVGNEIWLTDDGMNPETPIHEYIHLFVKAMSQEDSKEWRHVVELCKKNKVLWDEVANDPNYAHLQEIKNEEERDSAIASELLARYGGKRGSKQLEEKAAQMEQEGHSFESDVTAKLMVSRMKKAIEAVYQWALDKLGIPHHYKSIDEVVDKGLYNLLSESDINIADFTEEEQSIVNRAKADGTYMKAPNGNPTNLTPKQWAQTRTEAFKAWFGDWENDPENSSKCVDENGEPKIVYRGSKNANSYVFHTRYDNAGYWFTDNRNIAEHYARRGADHELSQEELDERVQPCFLNVRSSESVDAGGRTWQNVYEQPKYAIYDDKTGRMTEFDTREEAEQYCKENGLDPDIEIDKNNGISGDIAENRIINGADGMLFQNMIDGNAQDGTNIPSNIWVVKDNTQAKSAEENSGEFDGANPDIRFQIGKTKEEIEAQIESGDISKVDLAAEMYVKAKSQAYEQRKYDPSVPLPEQLTWLQGLRTSAIDEGYGLHILRQRMNAVRKAQGKKPVNQDKYDIRALRERAEAATAGRQKLLNDRQLHDLALVLYGKGRKDKGLIGAIENSALLKKYKTETLIDPNGKQQTVELSAQDLLNRYLIARDNIERIERGIPPRGLSEFKQRMGVDMVDFMHEFQAAFGIEPLTELHRRIKAVTDVSLDALHDAGMLKDEPYELYKSRKFYIPEKGFEDQRQATLLQNVKGIYDKVKSALTKALATDGHVGSKTDGAKQGVKPLATSYRARGGDSLGTDIIEHIVQDTYDAIAKAEQNKVKRAMYDLLREDHEVTNALRLPIPEEVYYVQNEIGEWVRKTDGVTAEEKIEAAAIDTQVQILANEAATTTDEETLNEIYREIDELLAMRPYADEYTTRNVWQNEQETRNESVGVWVDGVLQEMRFPNMVQVANALNGRRNTEKAIAAARQVNGALASICTNYNPTFFATNIVRDVPFIMKKGSSEYGFEFAGQFVKNMGDPRIQQAIWSYLAGSLDETNGKRFSNDFYDFVTGGGQTGYARTPEITEIRNKLNSWKKTGIGWRQLLDAGPKLNEWSELYTRFCAYEALLQMGKSKEEALKGAKNCSVNFNRRGFGGPVINIVNSLSMYANATIQGAMGFYSAFGGELQEGDTRGKRIARGATTFIAIPILMGLISTFLSPDDDDEERVVSDWERDNYLCLGDFRAPLNEQVKPFWLIGSNAALIAQGRRDYTDALVSISTACALNLVPCAPVVNETFSLGIQKMAGEKDMPWERVLQNLWTPQALRSMNYVAEGKDWLGNDLRKDYAAFPEYRMNEYQATMYKDLAYFGYRLGGGSKDYYLTYNEGEPIGYNRSPKEIANNLFSVAVPGGYSEIARTVWGLGHAVFTDDNVSESVRVKDIPIVNRFYKPTSPEMYRYNIYKQVREELQKYNDQLQTLKPQAEGGNIAADKELKRLQAEMIGRGIKAPETEKTTVGGTKVKDEDSADTTQKTLDKMVKEYNAISFYRQAKKMGLSEKEQKHKLIEMLGKEEAEAVMGNIDEKEKNLIQEMRRWLIDNKGVRAVMDADGTIRPSRKK